MSIASCMVHIFLSCCFTIGNIPTTSSVSYTPRNPYSHCLIALTFVRMDTLFLQRFSDESIDSFPLGLAAPNPPLTSLEGKILEAEKLKPSAAEPYFTPKRAHVCQAHEQSMFDPRLDHGKHAPAAALQQEGGIENGKPPVPCAPLFRVQGYGGVVRDYTRVRCVACFVHVRFFLRLYNLCSVWTLPLAFMSSVKSCLFSYLCSKET